VAQGPTNNILFVSKEDYEYTVCAERAGCHAIPVPRQTNDTPVLQRYHLHGIAAYWTGHFDEGVQACELAIAARHKDIDKVLKASWRLLCCSNGRKLFTQWPIYIYIYIYKHCTGQSGLEPEGQTRRGVARQPVKLSIAASNRGRSSAAEPLANQ
jgi:hypothetical protein